MAKGDEEEHNFGQWKYVAEWLISPKGIGTIVIFSIIWAITEFTPEVALGLGIGLIAMAIRYAHRRGKQEKEFLLFSQQENHTTSVPPIQPEPQDPEIHKRIIEDANPDFNEIRAASAVASGAVGENLRSIVKNAEMIQHELLRDSSKLSEVQRVFTYYIPATADLLTARGKAIISNDETKTHEIDNMIARLEAAFSDFAARMHGEDVRSIDIDIKLLDQSLKQDLPFEIRNKEKS